VNSTRLKETALACGAKQAVWLDDIQVIVFDSSFRRQCEQNACGQYGLCHMCPPDIGEIDRLIKQARSYGCGLLYQTVFRIEDSFDIEGMLEAAQKHNDCAAEIREALQDVPGLMHLSAGACRMCNQCSKVYGLTCTFPDKAISSLEAYGVDVCRSAVNAGMAYNNGPNTVTYFGLILAKYTPDA
jgi:predicted metal-binding protein